MKGYNMNDKRCNGCTMTKGMCFIRTTDHIKECPCIECLVKVMCDSQCTLRSNKLDELLKKGRYNTLNEGIILIDNKNIGRWVGTKKPEET